MAAAGAFTLLIAWTTVDLVRIHPYQYALFNHVAGGVQGAAQRYMTDYWGLAFKETSEALLDQLEERNIAPPQGRKWKGVDRARPQFRDDLQRQGRRLRTFARHVLLRPARRACARGIRARGCRLRARLRFARKLVCHHLRLSAARRDAEGHFQSGPSGQYVLAVGAWLS
jgi:hypothetical protein